jgi:hypothetical protein
MGYVCGAYINLQKCGMEIHGCHKTHGKKCVLVKKKECQSKPTHMIMKNDLYLQVISYFNHFHFHFHFH